MMPNVYPGQVAKKLKIPYVVAPHGTFTEYAMQSGSKIKRIYWPLVQRPALDATTCFHATAMSEYWDIRRLGFKQPVSVIPIGIDIPPYKRMMLDGKTRTLLYLGRIHPEKGIENLLYAWHAILNNFPEWHVKIIGPDRIGHLAKLKKLASKLKLKRIDFLDALYGEDKINAYRTADIFVLPSPSENFGIAVAEALSVGIPAIATKGTPWSELELRGAGWWIDQGIDSLVDCLKTVMNLSRDTLRLMGERGREWIQTEYAWSEIGHKMKATYKWIIDGGRKPAWIIEE
jgi:glycosyltransferase involved in cell wall biosynthesis